MNKVPNAEQWRVLILDDSIDAFNTLCRYFKMIGVQQSSLHWKSNGYDVIGEVDATGQRFDLIMLDIGFPGAENGYEILEKLKAEPAFQGTKIIALTGNVAVEEMRQAQAAGFDSFLGKPIDYDKFPQQIDQLMNGNLGFWDAKTTV